MKILLLLVFWCLWYFNFSSRTVISPLLPVIENELSITHAKAGGLFFFLSMGYAISLLLSWMLPSRVGYKNSILMGFLLLGFSLFCLTYTKTYIFLAFFLFIVGLGSGIYLPCAIPLLTSTFSRGNWGKAIAFHETAAAFSVLTIPLLTIFAMRFIAWRNLFLLLAGGCLLITIIFWALGEDTPPPKEQGLLLFKILHRKDFWAMTALWVLAGMNSAGLYNITPLFLINEKGMVLETANRLFGFSRFGGFLVTILASVAMDWFSVKKIFLVTLLATGLSTIGLAFAKTFWPVTSFLFIQGTVSVLFFPVGMLAISKITDTNERSIFSAMIIGVTVIVAMGLTPLGLGIVADNWNFQIGVFVLGVITLGACLLLKALPEI